MSESTLNKSKNYYRAVGTLFESGLKREDCKIKVRDENGNPAGTVNGERVMGNIALRTDNGIVTFNVYGQSLTAKNEPNKMWKMFTDMLEWNPETGGNSEVVPTLLSVEGSVSPNDYVSNGDLKYSLRWNVRRANTRVGEADKKATTLNATCYIQSMKAEERNEEETGRLLVKLMAVDNNGACFPIDAIVEENMADDFDGAYEVGQTVNFDFDLISRHVGDSTPKKKAFGRGGSVAVNSGFDVSELMIVGADDPIEEPDEDMLVDENGNKIEDKSGYINPVAMKKAIKVRAQMLDELKANPPEKKSGKSAPTESFKDKKAKMQKTKSKPVDDEVDDDELDF